MPVAAAGVTAAVKAIVSSVVKRVREVERVVADDACGRTVRVKRLEMAGA